MSDTQDVIDSAAGAVEKNPTINVLCILSLIGKGLQSLGWLLAAFMGGTVMNWVGNFMSDNSDQIMEQMEQSGEMEGITAEQMEQGMDMVGSVGSGLIIGVAVFMLILNVLALMGVLKMQKMKRGGFILYIVVNSICTLIMLFLFWPIALLQLVFIILFAVNAKYLKA